MYKYTYLKPLNGDAMISDVYFGKDGVIIVREKIEKLNVFVKEGWISVEPYDPKQPIVQPSVQQSTPQDTVKEPPPQLPNSSELDLVTKAVMGIS